MTVRTYRHAIYWRQEEILLLDRFHYLEPMVGLFHLQMNLLSMLFGKFWGVAGNMVSLNCYSGILKKKYIYKKPDNNNFHHTDEFFRVVIEAMVMMLCIYIARCSTIDKLQTWIGRFNWPILINKVERDYLGIFTVQCIQDKISTKTTTTITSKFDTKKKNGESWMVIGRRYLTGQ